jgi:predicted NBD/HSP70 family sugar kinase
MDFADFAGGEFHHRVAALPVGERRQRTRAADHLRAAPGLQLAAIAISAQGVVDKDARRVLWSPILTARGLDLAGPLEARHGVPVAVRNDCAMMAEALHWRDPGAWGQDFALLLIGRGVGMGLYLGGAPFEGRASSAAEFGHMIHRPEGPPCRCGARGCIEAYAADYALDAAAAAYYAAADYADYADYYAAADYAAADYAADAKRFQASEFKRRFVNPFREGGGK